MQIKNFQLEVIQEYKCFFFLDKISPESTEISISVTVPSGEDVVDFVDAFRMMDGRIVLAWKHPFQKLPLQALTARAGKETQIVNLYPFERIAELYNRPLDSNIGVYAFTNSVPIDGGDWRCDRGHYGAKPFAQELNERMMPDLGSIKFYEPFLSVPGVGHIVYAERSTKSEYAEQQINSSSHPTVAPTLQEVLRLVYEWYCVSEHPFGCTDKPAITARFFFDALKFSPVEFDFLANLPNMQIANYVLGDKQARKRPDNPPALSEQVLGIVTSRMASSSLSFIVRNNPTLWALDELLAAENTELEAGIRRFRDYYGLPDTIDMSNWSMIQDYAEITRPREDAYIHNQLRNFKNKQWLLDVAAGNETLIV